jgi:hypothetical protein
MTDRCEPPEELRGVDGWHWVQLPFVAVPTPMAWMTNPDNDEREWRMPSSPSFVSGESKTARTWRYLAPVTRPAEVDALRAKAEELKRAREQARAERDAYADANAILRATVAYMREALDDALGGWRYIRQHHGDLSGVGWDRVEDAARAALANAKEAGV